MRRIYTLSIIAFAAVCARADGYVDYVDTRVGTSPSVTKAAGLFGKGSEEHGQTLPAVLAPNGMNFWTPQTRDTELKCIAPYYYDDELLQGFRNSHWIVGGCTQDYGSMTLMPLSGTLRCQPGDRASRFSHTDETARPHYYSVSLPDEQVVAEMTGTSRCAIFRLRYDSDGPAYVVVNPNNDEREGYIAVDTAANMVYGYNPVHRIYQGKGLPAGFSGHFAVVFDRPIKAFGTYRGDQVLWGQTEVANADSIGAFVEFDLEPGQTVLAKAASSFVSLGGALANLQAELPGWDFDATCQALKGQWEQRLGVIETEGGTDADRAKLYGAMYRASFLPHEVNDVDGRYPAFASGQIVSLPEGESRYYDDYSMWDTYRALHPLVNLLFPTMGGEMMQSLVHKYEQGGWMPIFPCWGSYTAAMIGDHCASAIADAHAKGIRNFDLEKAYEGLRQNAFDMPTTREYLDGKGRRALASYLQYGYIPVEDSVMEAYHKREQTSRTLEYAYDDFALAQIAKALSRDADYNALMDRSKNYVYVINPATGYADGRHADGRFVGDNPFTFSKHITEGAPCHYTWYVPHDPAGLIEAMGGKDAYLGRLDSLFAERRYWHGNEPCHQVAYMYNYAGKPEKAARQVRHIMETEYLDCPGGLSGNDDAGQMSAWYVFAALGFYPVCPGTTQYAISGPTFDAVTIRFEDGHTLRIEAPGASQGQIPASATVDGQPIPIDFIDHQTLTTAQKITFTTKP